MDDNKFMNQQTLAMTEVRNEGIRQDGEGEGLFGLGPLCYDERVSMR